MERRYRRRARTQRLLFFLLPLLSALFTFFYVQHQRPRFIATGLLQMQKNMLSAGGRFNKHVVYTETVLFTSSAFSQSVWDALPPRERLKLQPARAILPKRAGKHRVVADSANLGGLTRGLTYEMIPSTSLIRVTDQSNDPELAAAIVNAAMKAATEVGNRLTQERDVRLAAVLGDRLDALQTEIHQQEADAHLSQGELAGQLELEAMSAQTAPASTDTENGVESRRERKLRLRNAANPPASVYDFTAQDIPTTLSILQQGVQKAALQQRLTNARVQLLKSLNAEDQQAVMERQDAALQSLDLTLSSAQADYAGIIESLGPNQPSARASLASITEVRQQIAAERELKLQQAGSQVQLASSVHAALTSAAERERQREAKATQKQALSAIQEISLAVNLTVSQDLQDVLRALPFTAGIEQNVTTIVDPADATPAPLQPVYRTVADGAVAGLGMAILGAIAMLVRERRHWTIEKLEAWLTRPVLASLPLDRHSTPRRPAAVLSVVAGRPGWEQPLTELAQALRLLPEGQRSQVLLFTSSVPGEGKSTIAVQLARTLAGAGERVLLLEANLHRPMIRHGLHLPGAQGLSTVLAGRASVDAAVQRIGPGAEGPGDRPLRNLDVLAAGPLPPHPSLLLKSDGMRVLLEEVRARYSYILIDAPPVLGGTDTLALGALVDAVFLVVRYGYVSLWTLSRTRNRILRAELPLLAAIVNGVPRH